MAGESEQWELAQVNIARLRAPLDSPRLAEFVAALDSVNALADAAAGFRWRLQDEGCDATAIPGFSWDAGTSAGVIVNLTVWASADALAAFTFAGQHRDVLRRRRDWFEAMDEAHLALWWVPAGHRPTVAEAEERLLRLRAHGPTDQAFTLRDRFAAPAAADVRIG